MVQHSIINIGCSADVFYGHSQAHHAGWYITVVDKTLTDIYSISASQTGELQLFKEKGNLEDWSFLEPPAPTGPSECLHSIEDLTNSLVQHVFHRAVNDFNNFSAANLHELQISKLQSFAFPAPESSHTRSPSSPIIKI